MIVNNNDKVAESQPNRQQIFMKLLKTIGCNYTLWAIKYVTK